MNIQTTLWKKPEVKEDIVYTPVKVSKHIIEFLNPKGKILDPCKVNLYDNRNPTSRTHTSRQYAEIL